MMESSFLKIQETNDLSYSFSYIGSSTGAIRISPSFKQQRGPDNQKCIDYDPRARPWYVSSITGSKTMVIMLDISKTMTSMHPGARFKSALATMQIILGTLNMFDYVGFVVFSKTASSLPGLPAISAATENHKNDLLSFANDIQTADGTTNYTAAF
jgi:hypothetical protein